MKTKTWSISIKGDKWKYQLLDQDTFAKKYGEDTQAECLELKHLIVFSPKSATLPIVRHELFHAYVASLHLYSSSIDQSNFEEIIAELLEHKWEEMDKKAKQIYKNLRSYETKKIKEKTREKKVKQETGNKEGSRKATDNIDPSVSDSRNSTSVSVRSQ